MQSSRQLRWIAVSVLVLSSGLNYLDRTILSALMPTLRAEFGIAGQDLGTIVAAFSITYAIASPFAGMLIDRIGLRWGTAFVVAVWSVAGMGTGFAGGLGSLIVYRALLGAAEAGGIPATGKGFATYLEPQDRALGAALNQVGITLGAMSAPLLTEAVSASWGWRSTFFVAGGLGFLWLPVWLWISARVPAVHVPRDPVRVPYRAILGDRRFLALLAANVLSMTIYSLWSVWLTEFLVSTYRLTQKEANVGFGWIPPIFATAGALVGGWIAQRLIGSGAPVLPSRLRIATAASFFAVATAAAPIAGSAALATAAVCISYFAVTCMSVNFYAMPLDLFGADRAAFAVSFLTGVYGLMTVFLSPVIGRWSDTSGWGPVCFAVAFLPLLSVLLLRAAFRHA